MPIPDFQEIMLPLLEVLSDGTARKPGQLDGVVADRLRLTQEERNKKIDSDYFEEQ